MIPYFGFYKEGARGSRPVRGSLSRAKALIYNAACQLESIRRRMRLCRRPKGRYSKSSDSRMNRLHAVFVAGCYSTLSEPRVPGTLDTARCGLI